MAMQNLLAIDPGNVESGYVIIEKATRKPLLFGKVSNKEIMDVIWDEPFDECVIEMVASYGMPVGAEVFETCVWIGRFMEVAGQTVGADNVHRMYRKDVKMDLCGNSAARDSNITRALVDRFAPGASNYGKGTKASPGWFYGFKKDIWAAYALAVTYADTQDGTVFTGVPLR